MTVTNESGGRLNAFANEPKIEVMTSEPRNLKMNGLLIFGFAFTLISIIGIYLISK